MCDRSSHYEQNQDVVYNTDGDWILLGKQGGTATHYHPEENIFPPTTPLCKVVQRVGTRIFAVYFDKHKHQHERRMAVYVFVAVTMTGRPINVCPEDDLPALLEIQKAYVTL
ncbi:hypothetical protein EDD15DRAFT_2195751 [Pisolithus albus]|nr:hypothetical protein EDD15DRAFT_2195751 [Pisolithus albus]